MDAPSIDAPAAEWLVYGDSLQTKGDARGALIAISHAIAEGKADASVRDAYVKEHAAALLGDAAGFVDTYRFDWRHPLPTAVRVRLGAKDGDHQLALLRTPLGSGLRELTLVGHSDRRERVDLSPAMRAALEHRPPQLTRLAFVDERAEHAHMLISRDFDPNGNMVTLGSLTPFYAVAEEIRIAVADSHQVDLAPIEAPVLEAFTLENLRFVDADDPGPMFERLQTLRAPNLERFRLRLTETWFANIALEEQPYLPVYSEYFLEQAEEEEDEDEEGAAAAAVNRYEEEAEYGDTNGVDWALVDGLLGTLAKCPLRELALTGFESSRSLVEALDRVGWARTLEVLDLSDSSLDDGDCAWIAAHPARFAQLKRLVVERTQVTDAGLASLRTLGVEVVHGGARVSYRYVVGSE